MRKHNGLTLRHLYAYAFLMRLSSKKRGYVPKRTAVGELEKRMDRKRRSVLRILKQLELAGWIYYLADSQHYHINSQSKVRKLYAPDYGKIAHKTDRTAMLNFEQFEAWCLAGQAEVKNHNNYDARREKEYIDRKGVRSVERKDNKGNLDRSQRKKHLGDLSCRYLSGVTGFSPAKVWRLRKRADELGFIKVIPRFDKWADDADIRTPEQLEAYIRMCDDANIHSKRFVEFYEKSKTSNFGSSRKYRMYDSFLVNTLKLSKARRHRRSSWKKKVLPKRDHRFGTTLKGFLDFYFTNS